ncbi:phosphotransferase family protein [Deinococcus yavapaiensis]|uniref:Phosphotransferase family enzyme n=1 Tax=Deinococcus yavapaiensis KR-236 TaxID=694435 RepID=A0A318S794_9DEIO|nr:aminoglycoside phosphotransferase family protein [Deinococcus yavapaiensis]PYE54634.1 phosphotransferase family enzyme [Deinococcus yavapaiensis KR-236]
MNLPDFPDLGAERLDAVLARHGLSGALIVRRANVGIFNAIFEVGQDLILRVPRQHPAFVESAHKESVVVPLARALGVRTPALVAFDDTLELLEVPYGLYERAPGGPLEHLGRAPAETPEAYREVGRDLARFHRAERTASTSDLAIEELPSVDALPDELAERGYVGVQEARWLTSWIAHLRVVGATEKTNAVLRHGDLQATNVLVRPSGEYVVLLDFGACGWGDAADDFAGVPLSAVPFMLDGYREEGAGALGASIEARIVARQLHIALFLARRGPQPDKSWAERPLGMLLDLVRTLATSSDPRWRETLP